MRIIQALDRGLQLMELLSGRDGSMGVTELALKLGVDKSTAYRLLATLEQRQYVEQDEHRRYRLSYRPVQIGMAQLGRIGLRSRAGRYLKELVERTQETAHLAQMIGSRVLYIDREESPNPVMVSTHVGGEAPPHCTATGKALVAFLPSMDMERFLASVELEQYTPHTITDLDLLRRHLHEVKQRGYASDDEERYLGVRCIAAPVFDYQGTVVASIGISGPAHRMTLERLEELQHVVAEIAQSFSTSIGFAQTA